MKATVPTDTQLRIPEDMNSVSDELLLSAANAIDSFYLFFQKLLQNLKQKRHKLVHLKVNILKLLSLK